ncbi:MAG TPA: restriction endonuclease, partial [Planctomycetota bacterium]|nr:restriction endonuclease [Planctomycetota bacterium]
DAVRKRLRPGMATDEVFRIAHRVLRQDDHRPVAARYSLQRAIQQLGPSGYPFERFVAELWAHEGYRVKIGVRLHGSYVNHEVDIDATRGKERLLGECKFRAQSDGKVDVKIALYVGARARDLAMIGFRQFWLITNGRFTKDALAYGTGIGMHMLSWDHPKGESLRDRIDRAGLHPVTVLSSLQKAEKQWLLRKDIVLCTDLLERPSLVDDMRLSSHRAHQLWQEIDGLSSRPKPKPRRRRRRKARSKRASDPLVW